MTAEQLLLEKWRSLPPDKQQEVFDFVEFLQTRQVTLSKQLIRQERESTLGERLQQIRAKIIAAGTPLLADEEIDREIAERRGGHHESE